MDKSLNIFIIVISFMLIVMFCALMSTTDRICKGYNAVYKTKVFGITVKKEYQEQDTYCKYSGD